MLKQLIACLLLFLTLSSPLQAKIVEGSTNSDHHEKIFILPENILSTTEGVYVKMNEELVPVKMIVKEGEKFFAVMDDKVCFNRHPIYHEYCWGCAHPWCHFRCKCHMPL